MSTSGEGCPWPSTSVPDLATTRRSRAKSDRRSQLDRRGRTPGRRARLSSRCDWRTSEPPPGVSGPAIYRHFPNKEALLVELLVGISTRLLAGRHATWSPTTPMTPARALDGLIDFHLDFALGESDLIRIQDRDLGHLSADSQASGRKAQQRSTSRFGWMCCGSWTTALERDRCPADGARDVRVVEFDTTRRETRYHENGRGQLACRPTGDDGRCADLGQCDRRGLVPGSPAADGPSDGSEDPEHGTDQRPGPHRCRSESRYRKSTQG